MLRSIFKKKKALVDLLFIFLLSLTPLLWLRPGQLMVGHDNVFPLEPKSFLKNRLYTWTEKQGFGQDQSLIIGTIPIHLIDAIPSLLGLSLANTQRVVFVFWFFLIGFSVYVFASFVNSKSRFFRLLMPVFNQFNFFILQAWFIAERTKFSAFVAMPLVLSVFLLAYREELSVLKAVALNSLILFLFNAGGVFGTPLYGGLFVVIGVFILYFSLLSFFQRKRHLMFKIILTAILTGCGFLLINAYYFLPATRQIISNYSGQLAQMGGKDSLINWAKMISINSGPLNLFRLQGMAEWYDNPQHSYAKYYLKNPVLIFLSFIWALLAFLSVFIVKDKKKLKIVLYFFFVYLVAIFFTAGTHPPFGFLYSLLMRFVPGFTIFRTPFYKFASALIFASSFLCVSTLDCLRSKIKLKFLPAFFSTLCFVLILAYHFPYFTVDFFNWRDDFSTRLAVPQYVFEFGKWVEQEKKDDLGVLVVPPPNESWNYDIYDWGYLSLFPLPRLLTREPIFLKSDETISKSEAKLLQLTYSSLLKGDKKLFKRLTSILRINYILVRKDFAYDLDWIEADNPTDYQLIIETKFNFSREREFGRWLVYKISDQEDLPIIYGAEDSLLIFGDYLHEEFLKRVSKEQMVLEGADIDSSLISKSGFLLSCLTCELEEEGEFVAFPTITILPDSPFYFFVKFKEKNLKKQALEPVAEIYHEIGLSLKRTAELRRMLFDTPPKDSEARSQSVNFLRENLKRIENKFFDLLDSDKKMLVAERLNFYLTTESEELKFYYRQAIMDSEVKADLENLIWQINLLINNVEPLLFNKDFDTNKLFSFAITEEGEFRILLKKKEIETLLNNELAVTLQIDDREVISDYEAFDEWFDFGEQFLTKGVHKFLLSVPSSESLCSAWKPVQRDFAEGSKDCFVSEVVNFSFERNYEVKFSYKNILYEDLFYYAMEAEEGKNQSVFFKPNSFVNLYLGAKKVNQRFLFFPNKKTKGLEIGFCAEGLVKEDFEEIFEKIEIKKLFSPLLFIEPGESKHGRKMVSVSSQKINPTKFLLKIENAQTPFVLVFLKKFSSDWKLTPSLSEKHFSVFTYANGWLIDKTGDYEIVLEYLPQKLFYIGIGLSTLSLILVILILKFKKK